MYVGLKKLEAAHQERRGYDFEIVKNFSLQQIDPLALIQLRETGKCEFALPELLFDMGFPGQYMRRIKSVAVTFACQVGPLTSINCVLRLLEHKFRTSAEVKGKSDYIERTEETDDRFSTFNVPITAIAVSGGQNDSGVFELNFRDERYVPFEGAGAISKWRMELPSRFREHDYQSFTDVVMTLRYVAIDAPGAIRAAAEDAVDDFVKANVELSKSEGLFALFDLRNDFPNEWYKSTQIAVGATERVIVLGDIVGRLPIFTKGTPPAKIRATDVFLFTTAALPPAGVSLEQGGNPFPLGSSVKVGTLNAFAGKEIDCPLTGWTIKVQNVTTAIDRMWVVVRYALK